MFLADYPQGLNRMHAPRPSCSPMQRELKSTKLHATTPEAWSFVMDLEPALERATAVLGGGKDFPLHNGPWALGLAY